MQPEPPAPAGYLHALQSLAEGLLASLQHRIELFGVELQEQKLRLIRNYIWVSAGICTGMLAVTFASLTLVYLFWETARLSVLAGLAGFYAIALLAITIGYRRYRARQPHPFAATLEEIAEDRACIKPRH